MALGSPTVGIAKGERRFDIGQFGPDRIIETDFIEADFVLIERLDVKSAERPSFRTRLVGSPAGEPGV